MDTGAHFLALLSNVDATIAGVWLGPRLRVRQRHYWEVSRLLAELTSTSADAAVLGLLDSGANLDSRECVAVVIAGLSRRGIDWTAIAQQLNRREISGDEAQARYEAELGEFQALSTELDVKVRLMRLFAPGAIAVSSWYFYSLDPELHRYGIQHSGGSPAEGEDQCWTADGRTANTVSHFLHRSWLRPFPHSYLELAFKAFDRSFQLPDPDLKFLSLMIASEVLFATRASKKGNISKGAAALLGRNSHESDAIRATMAGLYDLRCALVHDGKTGAAQLADVRILREYVRRAIVLALRYGCAKQSLLAALGL